jgi:hypothetical protein
MNMRSPAQALPYEPGVEQQTADEGDTNTSILASMQSILQTTQRDYGHPARSVHAKSHGLLQGKLHVLEDLPTQLAQGMFTEPGTYKAVLRFSTNPGDILDDTISTPRGVAIKIIGVKGERLPDAPGDTQDFVMVNGPAFVAANARAFAGSLKLLASTTDTGQAWKKLFSALLRGTVSAAKTLGADARPLKALGGQPMTNPLGETFYTQTPFRYGAYIAKFSLAPISPSLTALTNAPVRLAGKPNGLRAAIIDHFRAHDAEWELRVQLRTNAQTMPVEDASVPWPETESPYLPVARLTVPRQPAWSEQRAAQADDGLAFSPWHGLAAHRPLGSINRARRDAYPQSAQFRGQHTGCPMHEPGAAFTLATNPATIYGTTPGREGRRPGTPDARPGSWSQPMNPTASRITAGAAGGLAAGLLISAIMIGMEAAGEPSELVQLKRRARRRLGARRHVGSPTIGEQLWSHGGHLALSAASGAVYGAATKRDAPPLLAGTAFGGGFYALAYGIIGPLAGVSPKLWRDSGANIAQHGALHIMFGVVTAFVARSVGRRL